MPVNIVQDRIPASLAWNGKDGNYSRGGNSPRFLIMHATGASTYASTRGWFRDRRSGVSSQYVIDKDGTIYQQLDERDIAYTAGRSRWNGRENLNDEAIQIELVNRDNYIDPYPIEQYNAAVGLAQEIVARWHIEDRNVVSHQQVAIPAGRKKDPAGFDMMRFKYDVFSAPHDFNRAGQPNDPDSPIGGRQEGGADEGEVSTQSNQTASANIVQQILNYFFQRQNKAPSILAQLRRLIGIGE